jgi:plasmid stability protein
VATLNVKGLPDELYQRLKARAEQDRRSIAQEVSFLLTEALNAQPDQSIMDLEGLGKELWAGIDAVEYVRTERDSWD